MRFRLSHSFPFLLFSGAPQALSTDSFNEGQPPAHLRGKRSFYEVDGVQRTVFEHESSGATLDFVTNSGICETLPGVNQYSGYLSTAENQHMWFWFFEARHNASNAPLGLWLGGGPGCSSMTGVFVGNGPCSFDGDSTNPSFNPYSFNAYANMLYIDQPIGTGFSYGTPPDDSTVTAAVTAWKFMQAFFAHFPQYTNRDFGLFTQSYGGHYGPAFASYFTSQNAGIANNTVVGQSISLIALGINNGWFDPIISTRSLIDFTYNNTYKPLNKLSNYPIHRARFERLCLPLLERCPGVTGSDLACKIASRACNKDFTLPLIFSSDFNIYDIRESAFSATSPGTFVGYLDRPDVRRAIGANSSFSVCSNEVYMSFLSTGDQSRSFLPTLSNVVQSGVPTLIWAGDADWLCNWFGGLESAEAIQYSGTSEFKRKEVSYYTVDGYVAGTYKSVGNLSWMRVFQAGHSITYNQPELSWQVFIQMMSGTGLSST